MAKIIKKITRKLLNAAGFDLIRINNSPEHNLLGIRNLSIKSIIDVGANKGQFAKHISGLFPGTHLYCFEPLPEPFKELNLWAENRNGKVNAFNFALGEREGTMKIYNHVEHSPSSSFLKTTNTCESLYPFTGEQLPISVNMTTLDNWFSKLHSSLLPEILIKLDVQGYEDRVIRGGKETFKLAKICILEMNLDSLYESQATIKDIVLLLSNLGYTYGGNLNQTYAEDGHVIFTELVFIKRA